MTLTVHISNNSLKIHEIKTDKAERRNRQVPNDSWRLQSPSQQPIELLENSVNIEDLKK